MIFDLPQIIVYEAVNKCHLILLGWYINSLYLQSVFMFMLMLKQALD